MLPGVYPVDGAVGAGVLVGAGAVATVASGRVAPGMAKPPALVPVDAAVGAGMEPGIGAAVGMANEGAVEAVGAAVLVPGNE